MRIWDINPGYLNRQSLLGEHRELHGIFSIIENGKKGYSRHPETLRWIEKLPLLKRRHDLLVSEMKLRGYNHHSPLSPIELPIKLNTDTENPAHYPKQTVYINPPAEQFEILKHKYKDRPSGRIPLPINSQQLWAQHKYSIMARDPGYYKKIGSLIARNNDPLFFRELAREFVELLQVDPPYGRHLNAVQHMWGYVARFAPETQPPEDLSELLSLIRKLAFQHHVTYLIHSTALCD